MRPRMNNFVVIIQLRAFYAAVTAGVVGTITALAMISPKVREGDPGHLFFII
jgi:hypothetical protein